MTGPTRHQLDECAKRRARFMQIMGPDGVAIIPSAVEVTRNRDVHYRFRQDSDFRYLTGFLEPDAVAVLAPGRAAGEFVIFCRDRDALMEVWHGRRAGTEGAVAHFGADQAFVIEEFSEELPALLADRKRLYYTFGEHGLDQEISACVREIREVSRRGAAAPEEFIGLESSLHEMRLIKSPAELELMRTAGQVSAQAHVKAMQLAAPGLNEYRIGAELHYEFEKHGMEPGYGSIIAGGENACILHYTENNQDLRDGELLLIDAGGEFQGYTADITRTFPINGKYSGPQRALYEVVLAAQLAAIDTLRPENHCDAPHKKACEVLTEGLVALGLLQGDVRELIASEAYKRFYLHGTGHWLGGDVHDVGRYKIDGKHRRFEPGMVMTVEPGLYVPQGCEGVDPKFWGIGIRIEDDIVVTPAEPENLTAGVPKAIDEVEALMRDAAA